MNKLPDFFMERLYKEYNEEQANQIIEGYKLERKLTFRVNTIKTTAEEIEQRLVENEIMYKKVKWSKEEQEERPWWKNFLIGIKDRFIMFDTFMHLLPTNVINLFRWILVVLILRSCYVYTTGATDIYFFAGGTYLAQILRYFFPITIQITPGFNAIWQTFLIGVWARLFFRMGLYIENIIVPWYILFLERKRIKKMPIRKIFINSLLWPIFDIVGRYTTYIALFKKVSWKPVPHNSKITIDDINKQQVFSK